MSSILAAGRAWSEPVLQFQADRPPILRERILQELGTGGLGISLVEKVIGAEREIGVLAQVARRQSQIGDRETARAVPARVVRLQVYWLSHPASKRRRRSGAARLTFARWRGELGNGNWLMRSSASPKV